jgi:hypothetical protein
MTQIEEDNYVADLHTAVYYDGSTNNSACPLAVHANELHRRQLEAPARCLANYV